MLFKFQYIVTDGKCDVDDIYFYSSGNDFLWKIEKWHLMIFVAITNISVIDRKFCIMPDSNFIHLSNIYLFEYQNRYWCSIVTNIYAGWLRCRFFLISINYVLIINKI